MLKQRLREHFSLKNKDTIQHTAPHIMCTKEINAMVNVVADSHEEEAENKEGIVLITVITSKDIGMLTYCDAQQKCQSLDLPATQKNCVA